MEDRKFVTYFATGEDKNDAFFFLREGGDKRTPKIRRKGVPSHPTTGNGGPVESCNLEH